jgi:TolB-like protein/DNA-binding winged helix-turn-helix (wHTH) protein/Flp pilus assembly protein TadD
MTSQSPHIRRIDFGTYALDVERGALFGPNGELKLRPKSYEVLAHLVRNAGRLVTKDELLDAVWGRAVVTEDSLSQCLVEIRRALGEEGREVIRTVPRRGYIFDVPVSMVPGRGDAAVENQGAAASSPPLIPPSAPAPAKDPTGMARSGRLAVRSAALLLAVVVLAWSWPGREAEAPMVPREQAPRADLSIAVLPFSDMSPGRDHEYFGDGISEEILNLLVQGTDLRVIARTSSFSVRDQSLDIPAIGARLGVSHILEGSVRRSGERVRITAQLVDARDGSHLWSQTFDRQLGDVIEAQAEIATSVAGLLQASLSPPVGNAASPGPRAYDHFLRGRFLFNRRGPGDVQRAVEHFQAALELESDYAPAWAWLAGAWLVWMGDFGLSREEGFENFVTAAERAVELDPRLPEAQIRAAMAARFSGDQARAEHHWRIAETLDAENPLLLGLKSGGALGEGDLERAIELQRRAVARDPLVFSARGNLAFMLLGAGRVEEARAEFEAARLLGGEGSERTDLLHAELLIAEGRHAEAVALLEARAEDDAVLGRLVVAYHLLGRDADAGTLEQRLRESGSARAAQGLVELHAQRGEPEEAFAWLAEFRSRLASESAFESDSYWRRLLHSSQFLRPLRADSRWAALLAAED